MIFNFLIIDVYHIFKNFHKRYCQYLICSSQKFASSLESLRKCLLLISRQVESVHQEECLWVPMSLPCIPSLGWSEIMPAKALSRKGHMTGFP